MTPGLDLFRNQLVPFAPLPKYAGRIFKKKEIYFKKNIIRWTNSMDNFTYLRYNIKKVKLWDLIFKTEGTLEVSKN